jgi:shikimate dehydrogenase
MPIDAAAQVVFMIGWPIAQARSPLMFNELFASNGTNVVMAPLALAPRGLDSFVLSWREMQNSPGILATTPHKPGLMKLCDRPSSRSVVLESANVVRRTPDGLLECDALDAIAFTNSLKAAGIEIQQRTLAIVGCGAAGAACAWQALLGGAKRIELADLKSDTARSLRSRLLTHFSDADVEVSSLDRVGQNCNILVNAAPGYHSGPIPFKQSFIEMSEAVIDLDTHKSCSALIEVSRSASKKVVDGAQFAVAQFGAVSEYFGQTPT